MLKLKHALHNKEFVITFTGLLSVLIMLLLTSFANYAVNFVEECESLQKSVFRLHILANSDSESDQAMKYKLRDYLLSEFGAVLATSATLKDAKALTINMLPEITAKSNEFLAINGSTEQIKAEVSNIFFTTRVYENLTMPAGNYEALRITIGDGAGKNWWCVMFPPLCLPMVTEKSHNNKKGYELYFTEEQSKLIENGGNVEVKFAIYEFFKKYFG